jgi:hypothetical protein
MKLQVLYTLNRSDKEENITLNMRDNICIYDCYDDFPRFLNEIWGALIDQLQIPENTYIDILKVLTF